MPDLTCANPSCRKPFSARKGTRFCSRECQLAGHNLARRTGTKRSLPDALPTHVFIPDTQVKPGVPNDHIVWLGKWLKERWDQKPLVLVHAGDHWDMPSLSSYDKKGGKKMEGRRVWDDILAGNHAFELLEAEIGEQPLWRKVLLRGNHEHRITKAIEGDVQLEGLLSLDQLKAPGWEVHPFLEVVDIDGVRYSHYFYNPMSGRPYSGDNLHLRLKTIGHTFVMGHQQTKLVTERYLSDGTRQRGVVAGAFYQHDEDYKGPQGNAHWRGVLIFNNVHEGSFDVNEVEINYLCRRYEGHAIAEHIGKEL